jgi:hypothetical protein
MADANIQKDPPGTPSTPGITARPEVARSRSQQEPADSAGNPFQLFHSNARRCARYAGNLATLAWLLAGYVVVVFLLCRMDRDPFDARVAFVVYGGILAVTLLPLLGIAALVFGIKGWTRKERDSKARDYIPARFGVATGILTALWTLIVLYSWFTY